MEEKSWPKIIPFAKKHALLLTLLLVLMLQFVPNGGTYPWGGMWMRMQVKELPFADRAASSSVENFLQQQASVLAAQQYPNLPESNKQKVINDLIKKLREDNKADLEREEAKLSKDIKDHYSYNVDDRTFGYMPDIDPYYYLRYSRNLIEKGHKHDTIKDGVPWDDHTVAPIGSRADRSWHPEVLALIFKVYHFFDKQVTLMQASTYFPIIFILISLIFTFLITQKVAGNMGGFFSVTMLALLPAVLRRTPWGHADTDAYNIFFPVLVVWLLFEALSADSRKKQIIWSGLSGLVLAIFAKFWVGWWYLFDFIGAALAIAILVEFFLRFNKLKQGFSTFWKETNVRKYVTVGISLFIVCALASTMLIGFSSFWKSVFSAAFQSTAIKDAAKQSLWPNVFTTVAELNPSTLPEIINSVGGNLIFFIAILGIIFLLLRRDEHGKINVTYSALLAIWFIGTIYMSLKGTRFTLLLGPAFAVAFGAAIGIITERLSKFGEKQLHINKIITKVLLVIIVGLVIMNPTKAGEHMIKQSYAGVLNDVPLVNDAWWDSLTKIKEESSPNAIINSWWDFGHHFKFIADRKVTFDGGTQNSPQAHWVGRVLQTDNEEEAVAILRMLDCGANNAYKTVFETKKDSLVSVNLVKNMILVDKEEAISIAKEQGIPETIVQYTHCDPPENYFIASADMIGKAGVWAHFGLWNFDRAEIWKKWKYMSEAEAVPQMTTRFGISDDTAKSLYIDANSITSEDEANTWISPWPGYITPEPSSCKTSEGLLKCGKIVLDMSSKTVQVSFRGKKLQASKIIMYEKNGSKEIFESKGNKELAVVIWPTKNGIKALAADSNIADSIFTRLFYMKGLGLKHFKPFSEEQQMVGGMIYVYKLDWQGSKAFIPKELQPKSVIGPGAKVSLNYIGWTNEGIFDSSIVGWKQQNISQYSTFENYETSHLSINFGEGKLIPGFELQLIGMKTGEEKTITVKPEEGYGIDPKAHPLGNKTLQFKIKIVSVQ